MVNNCGLKIQNPTVVAASLNGDDDCCCIAAVRVGQQTLLRL